MNRFPEILKDLRCEKGYTQGALADLSGLSKSAISMYERGDRLPDIETLQKFAEIFNVSVDYLIGADSPNNEIPHDPSIRRIARARTQMPPNEQERMMKILEVAFEEFFKDNSSDKK